METTQRSPSSIYLEAIRPKTLLVGLMPVLLASFFAWQSGAWNTFHFLCLVLATLALQSLSNLSNDYYDYLQGADTKDRKGFERMTANKLLSPKQAKSGILVLIVFSLLPGAYLVYHGGLLILAVGLLSIATAYAYTAKPFALAYRGFGELLVIVFFGLIAINVTYFLYTSTWKEDLIYLSLAFGFLQTAVLVVNNIRDFETDRACNKKTLVVRFGVFFGKLEYSLLLLLAAFVPSTLFWNISPSMFALLPCILLLISYRSLQTVWSYRDETELNGVLTATAQSIVFYTVLLSATSLLSS